MKKSEEADWIGLPVHLKGRFFRIRGRRYLVTWWPGPGGRTFLVEVLDDCWYPIAQWKRALSLANVIKRCRAFGENRRKVAE